jgi:hypothetical protein
MTTVVVSGKSQNGKGYRAVSGEKESFGKTVGEAIDAIADELEFTGTNAVVYLQDFRPDEFFTQAQQRRLGALMKKWRSARDKGLTLDPHDQAELEKLIEIELEGSGRRAQKLAEQLFK